MAEQKLGKNAWRRRKRTNVNMVENGANAKTVEEALFVSMVEKGANAKDCGGASICEHNKRRSYCKECGGNCICEHGRERSKCIDCGGSSICEHDKIRSRCPLCDPLGHLCHVIRCQVRQALKKKKKELSSQEYLECDIETFRKHIEEQLGKLWQSLAH